MTPEGYTTVTISDELAEKLTQIMGRVAKSSRVQ